MQTRSCTNPLPRCSGPGRVDLLESDKRFGPSQSVSQFPRSNRQLQHQQARVPNLIQPPRQPGGASVRILLTIRRIGVGSADCPFRVRPSCGTRGLHTVPSEHCLVGYFICLLQSYMRKNSVPCLRNRISRPRFGHSGHVPKPRSHNVRTTSAREFAG